MQKTVRMVLPDELYEPVRSGVRTTSLLGLPDLLINKLIVLFTTDTPIRPSLMADLCGAIKEGREKAYDV